MCCFACNRHKGPNIAGIGPESGRIVPLFRTRRHKWSRRLPVGRRRRLIGLTPNGRATVRVLGINLDHRVGFRRALIEEGGFPPPG